MIELNEREMEIGEEKHARDCNFVCLPISSHPSMPTHSLVVKFEFESRDQIG